MTKKQEIKALAAELAMRSHGEIFKEYYEMGLAEELTIRMFALELDTEAKEDLDQLYSDDINSSNAIVTLFRYGHFGDCLKEYFTRCPSHGEAAGRAMAACYNDSNAFLALDIFNLLEPMGFDS